MGHELRLKKDAKVIELLGKLSRDLGEGSFEIVDHWEVDLMAVGVAKRGQPRRLAYILTPDEADGVEDLYLDLEVPGSTPEPTDFKVIARWESLPYEELRDHIARHLGIGAVEEEQELASTEIRRLNLDDAAAYRALMLHGYADAPEAFTATVDERRHLPLDWWFTRVSEEPDAAERVYGAFVGEELVGVAGLKLARRPKKRHQATLYGMYVSGEHRGRGLGRALVKAVLDGARETDGIQMVKLTVTDSNAGARALYEGCGFRLFGVEPMAIRVGDDFLAKAHMWCSLEDGSEPMDEADRRDGL